MIAILKKVNNIMKVCFIELQSILKLKFKPLEQKNAITDIKKIRIQYRGNIADASIRINRRWVSRKYSG